MRKKKCINKRRNMQYALLKITDNYNCLIDAHEIMALESKKSIIENELDDSSFKLKILYGFYYQQIDKKFTDSEVSSHINDSINKWLIHLSGLKGIYLGINDILLLKNFSNKTAFASLVALPDEFQLKGQVKTAFVRYHDISIQDNLINRLGLFSFFEEETRNISDLTELNWKNKVDREKVISKAFSIF